MTKNQISKIIEEHGREFKVYSWFNDTSDIGFAPTKWEKAEKRILVNFFSDAFARDCSNTMVQLQAIIREHFGDKFYIDWCFLPEISDAKKYIKYNLPYIFGWRSRQPLEEFDLILCSQSIFIESLNIPFAYHYSDLELGFFKRLKDHKVPFILFGGISVDYIEWVHGYRDGSPADAVYIGQAEERTPLIIEEILKFDTKTEKAKILKALMAKFDNVYFPSGYEFEHDYHKITGVKKKYDWLPDKVQVWRPFDIDNYPRFEDKIFPPSGSHAHDAEVQISYGCGGSSGSCYFCAEAMQTGPWREASLEALKKSMDRIKIKAAPNILRPYSFNLDYYGKFIDFVHLIMDNFKAITTIKMRVDSYADAEDYSILSYATITSTQGFAIEGFSQRMRDVIMNKTLTREQIMKACSQVFKNKMMSVRFNYIFTGYETEDDVKEFDSELQEINSLRIKYGANTHVKITITPLTHYPHTPLYFLPRAVAKKSATLERSMAGLIDAAKKNGCSLSIHGSGGATFVYQFLIDGGRIISDMIFKFIESKNYDIAYMVRTENLKPYKNYILDWVKATKLISLDRFFGGHTPDEPSSVPVIEVVPEDLYKMWYESVNQVPKKPCLRTVSNLDPKCYGCQMCPPKHIPKVTKRKMESEHTVEDVRLTKSLRKGRDAFRVNFWAPFDIHQVSKRNFNFIIASKMLEVDLMLRDDFYSVENESSKPYYSKDQFEYFYGNFSFDLFLERKQKDAEIQKYESEEFLSKVNNLLESVTVTSVKQIEPKSLRGADIRVLASWETEKFSVTDLKSKTMKFDGFFRFKEETGYSKRFVPEEDYYYNFRAKGSKVIGTLHAKAGLHPYNFLGSVFDLSWNKIVQNFDVRIWKTFLQPVMSCSCGKDQARIDMHKNEVSKYCPTCYAKAVLLKLTN